MTYRDIHAYFELMDVSMQREYINLILSFDYKYVLTYYEVKNDIESRVNPRAKK